MDPRGLSAHSTPPRRCAPWCRYLAPEQGNNGGRGPGVAERSGRTRYRQTDEQTPQCWHAQLGSTRSPSTPAGSVPPPCGHRQAGHHPNPLEEPARGLLHSPFPTQCTARQLPFSNWHTRIPSTPSPDTPTPQRGSGSTRGVGSGEEEWRKLETTKTSTDNPPGCGVCVNMGDGHPQQTNDKDNTTTTPPTGDKGEEIFNKINERPITPM